VSGDSYTVANFAAKTGSFAALSGIAPLLAYTIGSTATRAQRSWRRLQSLAVSNVSEPASGAPATRVTVNYTVAKPERLDGHRALDGLGLPFRRPDAGLRATTAAAGPQCIRATWEWFLVWGHHHCNTLPADRQRQLLS